MSLNQIQIPDDKDDPDTHIRSGGTMPDPEPVENGGAGGSLIQIHPYADFVSASPKILKAHEYIVDNVLTAGASIIAGDRGMGKTTTLVPLLMVPTGLLVDYPMKATVRRKVIYVTEDIGQAQQIIAAMFKDGMLACKAEELNEWFKLVEAKRMKPADIVKVAPAYVGMRTDNPRADGTAYSAAPVLVLDTFNSCIDLDNLSDNSEVGKAISTLRQEFGDINIVLIHHIPKAARESKTPSSIGAGALEALTQQTLYLIRDDVTKDIILKLDKKRFQTPITEYVIQGRLITLKAPDVLGHMKSFGCYYGVPRGTTDVEMAERADRVKKSEDAAKAAGFEKRVLTFIRDNPNCNTNAINRGVSGAKKSKDDARKRLVKQKAVIETNGPNSSHTYRIAEV